MSEQTKIDVPTKQAIINGEYCGWSCAHLEHPFILPPRCHAPFKAHGGKPCFLNQPDKDILRCIECLKLTANGDEGEREL